MLAIADVVHVVVFADVVHIVVVFVDVVHVVAFVDVVVAAVVGTPFAKKVARAAASVVNFSSFFIVKVVSQKLKLRGRERNIYNFSKNDLFKSEEINICDRVDGDCVDGVAVGEELQDWTSR